MPSLLLRCLALVLGLAAATSASAFERSRVPGRDACLHWLDREVTWHLNERGSSHVSDDSDIIAAISSFKTWSEPSCSDLTLKFGGLIDRVDIGFDPQSDENVNLVVFRPSLCVDVVPEDDPCWVCYEHDGPCCSTAHDCWSHAPGAIAITTTTFFVESGALVDADIELNEPRFLFTTVQGPRCEEAAYAPPCASSEECEAGQVCLRERCRTEGCSHTDIANTLTHEVGHLLGLDHSAVRAATMYPTATIGETSKRRLHADDMAGLCHIYPVGGPTPPCGSSSGSNGSGAPGGTGSRGFDCSSADPARHPLTGVLSLVLLAAAALLRR